MSKFLYTVFLPGLNKTVHLTELFFTEFKQLVKIITNNNDDLIAQAFDEIIKTHCIEDVSHCTAIDKLLILLTIRMVCISPVLEMVVTCPETKKTFNCSIDISDINKIIENIRYPEETKTYINDIEICYNLPSSLYIPKDIDSMQTVISSVSVGDITTYDIESVINRLPANILRDAKTFMSSIYTYMDNIELLKIASPFNINAKPITLTANIFNGSVLELLKICFRRDLMSMYQLEYFLMSQFRTNYETLNATTPAELSIYVNLFKEEQKEKEKEQKDNSMTLNPTQ